MDQLLVFFHCHTHITRMKHEVCYREKKSFLFFFFAKKNASYHIIDKRTVSQLSHRDENAFHQRLKYALMHLDGTQN